MNFTSAFTKTWNKCFLNCTELTVIASKISWKCHQFTNSRHVNRKFIMNTVKPLLRGHPDERPPPLERPLDNVILNINVLTSTPGERPPLLKGHFSDAKGAASQEGFHCIGKKSWFAAKPWKHSPLHRVLWRIPLTLPYPSFLFMIPNSGM